MLKFLIYDRHSLMDRYSYMNVYINFSLLDLSICDTFFLISVMYQSLKLLIYFYSFFSLSNSRNYSVCFLNNSSTFYWYILYFIWSNEASNIFRITYSIIFLPFDLRKYFCNHYRYPFNVFFVKVRYYLNSITS